MEPAYFVSQFSLSVLSILIKQCFGSDFRNIENKAQVKTLVAQLTSLGAKTIVCERAYIDRDYSEDYANYYVQSFKDYKGSCARLHFFSEEFEQEDFHALLMGATRPNRVSKERLQDSYLGFVVIKPLPFTFLGRSCIATLSKQDISRAYKANLFGIELSVNAVAFQEQDRVVSACATTAVWSLLHALPDLHKINIPSPSAITLAAIGSSNQNVNGFPNKGLNLVQITCALEALRLKQHSYQIESFDSHEQIYLKKFVSCYVDSKIPIFLGARIFKAVRAVDEAVKPNRAYALHGDHAVIVTGIRSSDNDYGLVVHDDRIGPYLEMKLISIAVASDNMLEEPSLNNSHLRRQFAFQLPGSDEIFVPTTALVATYPKKKIGVEPIIRTAEFLLDAVNKYFVSTCDLPPPVIEAVESIQYRVQLLDSKDLKVEYLENLVREEDRNVLTAHLPRFIWRAQLVIADCPILDMLFDATDTPNGNPFIQLVKRDSTFSSFIVEGLKEIGLQLRVGNTASFEDLYSAINEGTLYSYHIDVLRRVAPSALTRGEYLAQMYGGLRSPRYVRSTEANVWPPQITAGDALNRYRIFSAKMAKDIDITAQFEILKTDDKNFIIWVIDEEGALVFGPDAGHPTLTDANPARIAGELHRCECGEFFLLNAKSGRYSGQYADDDKLKYLENAAEKWSSFFGRCRFVVHPFPCEANFSELKRDTSRQAA